MVILSTSPILLASKIRSFASLLEQVQQEMLALSNKVSEVESENKFLKKLPNENSVQEYLHSLHGTLHAEILDLKNKQEEIKTQQATFKQQTETHISSNAPGNWLWQHDRQGNGQ
jgi:DNA repair exonuclease SbcCD ATPase subunit